MALQPSAARDGALTLALGPPHADLCISAPRASDRDTVVRYLNDRRVANNLTGPPFPYTAADAEAFLGRLTASVVEARAQWEAVAAGERRWMDCMPVRSIYRGDAFLGDVDLHRCSYTYILDKEEQARLVAANQALPAGDPRIVWEFGDYLGGEHHGQGIMSAVIGAVIANVAVPLLNAHHIECTYYEHNPASRRVFEKNGFVYSHIVPDAVVMPESKGGGIVSVGIVKWTRPVDV